MTEKETPVVRVAGLAHRYGSQLALDGVALDLPNGRLVGLIGPDGVGKSTLLGIIVGAKRIQAGKVMVLGGDMAGRRHRTAVCPRIAYMPQGLGKNLYPDLSVRENIDFFGRLFGQSRGERQRRIDSLLADTGLSDFGNRPAKNLSGGMRQKLGLCCALVHDPDLLVLDEPSTGVDPLLSLLVVVRGLLGVPIVGSIPLFMAGVVLYLFFAVAIGIFLGTVARSMPQLGLLFMLIALPMNMLSGGNTPLESMPPWLRIVMQASPSTHFVSFAEAILYRGAGLDVVWPRFLAVAAIGGLFLALALVRFRKVASAAVA